MTKDEKDAACAWWNKRVLLEQTVNKAGTVTTRWALPLPPKGWGMKGEQSP